MFPRPLFFSDSSTRAQKTNKAPLSFFYALLFFFRQGRVLTPPASHTRHPYPPSIPNLTPYWPVITGGCRFFSNCVFSKLFEQQFFHNSSNGYSFTTLRTAILSPLIICLPPWDKKKVVKELPRRPFAKLSRNS